MTNYSELQQDKAIANFCAQSMHDKRFMSFTLNTRLSKSNIAGSRFFMDEIQAKRAITHTFYKVRRALIGNKASRNHKALASYATYETGAHQDNPHIHGAIEIPFGLLLTDMRSSFMPHWIKTGWATMINDFVEGYTPDKWFDYITKKESKVLIFNF